MTPQEARALVAALPEAREHWLAKTVESVRARAVWLTGSLGRGQADEWSDVDLIVVGGSPLLDDALVTTDNPGNGPIGGGHIGALYDIGPLTLWADWYLWPSQEPVPSDARLLRGQGNQGIFDLSDSLNRIGRGRPRPHPDRDAFALAMLPLAAKFIARGANDKAASIAAMLGAPPDTAVLDGLRSVFSSISGHDETRILVDRYLQVVEALARR
jgi:Nucleotidyltransferase domain